MPPLKHRIGTRFGRLVITARDGTRISCKCDCGNETVVHLANLCTGHTVSCGCVRVEVTTARCLRHGASKRLATTPTYLTWCGMRKRCLDQNCKSWKDYGGRGITICDEWASFESFLRDMGEKPSPLHSLEREDNNGPYSPNNCVWALRTQQNRNTRRNFFITHAGKTQALAAWAEETGVPRWTIRRRLQHGWDVARALSAQVNS